MDTRTPATLDGTYGWRARIGFVTVASTIETPTYEFQLMAPAGVVLVSAHLTIRNVEGRSIAKAKTALEEAARELGLYHIDHIVVSGSPLAYWSEDAPAAAAEITEIAAAAAGVPATYEWSATMDALRHVGAQRLAVASPFTEASNERLVRGLAAEGFEVAGVAGRGLRSNAEFTIEPLRSAYEVSRQALSRAGDVDALYITCPRWPVVPIIGLLEEQFGLPVIASVPAWLWAVMRHLRISTAIEGYGRLLADASRRNGV